MPQTKKGKEKDQKKTVLQRWKCGKDKEAGANISLSLVNHSTSSSGTIYQLQIQVTLRSSRLPRASRGGFQMCQNTLTKRCKGVDTTAFTERVVWPRPGPGAQTNKQTIPRASDIPSLGLWHWVETSRLKSKGSTVLFVPKTQIYPPQMNKMTTILRHHNSWYCELSPLQKKGGKWPGWADPGRPILE